MNQDNILENLNDRQKEAVLFEGKPLLVLAGAGSGKTKVLTHRAAWFIQTNKVNPENLVLLTFTNKAADEMKSRIIGLSQKRPFFAGTFHSFCAKLLRIDGKEINIPPDFIIYDEDDSASLIKEIIEKINLPPDFYKPKTVLGAISDIKTNLLNESEYKNFAKGEWQENIARIYSLYQKTLQKNAALDFDDLLLKGVELLQESSLAKRKWQEKIQMVLVDEWQDTNKIQYVLTKLLAGGKGNITAVGDASQCLPPETLIETPTGSKRIDSLKSGDVVISATGRGQTEKFPINKVHKRRYNGKLIVLKTVSGKTLRLTPNHILFARLQPKENLYHVYLMYRQDKGFRIGQAKGLRAGNTKNGHLPLVGIATRGNQESADKMWVLKTCNTRADATYWEFYFAFKYGIPTVVFSTDNRSIGISQDQINRLYSEINTKDPALRLIRDLEIDPRFPHHRPKGVSGYKNIDRQVVHLKFFEDPRRYKTNPWGMHRIALNTTDRELEIQIKKAGFYTREGRKNTWRTEITRKSYEEAENIAIKLSQSAGGIDISYEIFLTKGKEKMYFQPASHIQKGMIVGFYQNEKIIEEEIADVQQKTYNGLVYDLDIDKTHNYIASGIVVHNSIYSWRGADFRNINNLIKDFPNIKVINLEQNYRSTKTILKAANSVIQKNKSHPVLSLWTQNKEGEKILIYQARNQTDEAVFVAEKIKEVSENNKEDIAVLYRTNAQSRTIEEAFLSYGIKYKLFGGVRFYNRAEIKDIISFLRLIVNPKDSVSKKRIQKLGKRRLDSFEKLQEELKERTQNLTTLEIMDIVLDKTKYLDKFKRETEENLSRLENIKELRSVAREFENLNEFLENIALIEAEQEKGGKIKKEDKENAVYLMTLHSAKGLEFKYVFIVGLEEGIFPHSRSLNDANQLEEERRLAYVGITRAKERLFLTFAKRRLFYGDFIENPPSRFLQDIPKDLINQIETESEIPDKSSYSDFFSFEGIIEKYLKENG